MKITLFGCPLEAASIPRAPVPAKTSMIKLEFNGNPNLPPSNIAINVSLSRSVEGLVCIPFGVNNFLLLYLPAIILILIYSSNLVDY